MRTHSLGTNAPIRAAVTGIGVRTALGHHPKELWSALTEGRSAARPITSFDARGLPVRFACEVPSADADGYASPKEAGRMGRATLLAFCAAADALADASTDGPDVPPERRGVVIGTAYGGAETYEEALLAADERGWGRPHPLHVPKTMHNAPAAMISIRHRLLGPSLTVSTACASGGHAVGEALRMIRDGSADVVVAGGTDAIITPTVVLAMLRCGALSRQTENPASSSRPFDAGRDGFVMGEGSAFVVVERLDRALRRGARIHAELAGYGRSSDAHHLTMPDPDGSGAYRCMRQALDDARLSFGDVVHVNAHATGTVQGDLAEARAITRLFGPGGIPVTAPKSALGHTLGAAGAIEAVIAAMTLSERTVPPTLHLGSQDPACEVDVVRRARPLAAGAVLSNSFGFGGHNACLLFVPAPD